MLNVTNFFTDTSGSPKKKKRKKRKYEWRNRRIYSEALNMNNREFLRRYRVSKQTFNVLLELIRNKLKPGRSNNGKSVTPEERLLIFLFSAGSGISNFNAAYAHNCSEGVIHQSIDDVMKAIMSEVVPKYICLPTPEEAAKEARLFQERSNFPPRPHQPIVWGAIDGTHVCVSPPEDKRIECINRHGTHSLNCMILAGASFRIYACSTNAMGAQHDSKVYRNSDLYKALHEHNFKPIPNGIIIGDQGYPDKDPNIGTPFIEGVALNDEAKKEYNEAFIPCRLPAEQSIGVWKARFPPLRKGLEFCDLDRCSMFCQCCIGI